jgi:ligand-binding sensor domain-containing protein
MMVPALAASFVVWRTLRAREEAVTEATAASERRFRLIPIGVTSAGGVESISADPGFRDIAVFNDTVVVSGQAGLFLYDRGGGLLRVFRPGPDLPPAELGALSTGLASASPDAELFIATHGQGVLAFNGTRFRQLLPEDPRLRNTTAVLALRSGRILMGTERQGLLVFDGRILAPFHAKLSAVYITAIAGDDGDLWIGTLENGVFHYHGGELDDLAASLPDARVLSLAVIPEAAYVGTPVGIVEFRKDRPARKLAEGFFARSLLPRGDTLDVGTEDEGILEVSLQNTRRSVPGGSDGASLNGPIVRLANLGGERYAVTESSIYHFDSARRDWRPVVSAAGSSMNGRNVSALAVSGGRLWVGYFDRGLDVLPLDLARGEHREDDVLFCVNRIVPDPSGERVAVATANGLAIFDAAGRSRQVMGRKDGLVADHVTDVAFREDGMVVATPAGLSYVDRTGVRSLYVFHGLVNNHVYTVAAAGKEVIAGTLGGISLLNGDVVQANYTSANSHLRHNWVTAIARVGSEWFAGTYGGGVLRLDAAGQWTSFPDLKDGFVVNPNALLGTAERVYAGSLDRGLFVFERSSGRWRNTFSGLPSLNVTALAANGGYLYVGTDNGLVRIPEGSLR